MADSLGEIYRNTITPSNLSNGEVTLVTTNSSTSHVIRDIKSVNGDANFNMDGTLEINGYQIASTSTNASGTEIMGPSSTLKFKSDYTETYTDLNLSLQTASGTLSTLTLPLVNGLSGYSSSSTSTTNVSGRTAITSDESHRTVYTNLGPSNNTLVTYQDMNSITRAYLSTTSNSNIWNNTDGYRPKWFDGSRYVWWLAGWNFYGRDTWSTGTQGQDLYSPQLPYYPSESTYPKCFGCQGENGTWIFAWPQQNQDPYFYNVQGNTVGRMCGSGNTAYNLFDSSPSNSQFQAVHLGDDKFIICQIWNTSTIKTWYWDSARANTGSFPTATQHSLETSHGGNGHENFASVGNRLYYFSSTGAIQYIEFSATDDGTMSNTQGSLGATLSPQQYGWDLMASETTPSSSTISSRTYTHTPSVGLRITGVTST